MTTGCTQLTAVNFDPLAQLPDYSCMYIFKVWDTVTEGYKCIWFKDVEGMKDYSFTLSYSVEAQNWVFFHDYIPDFYYHTREQLYDLYASSHFKHNADEVPGIYHDPNSTKTFFIDIVFKTDSDFLLETVNWISSVGNTSIDLSDRSTEWNTLTHISIWNSQQHTGRIALSDIFTDLQYNTSRKTKGAWSMNDFRNIVTARGTQFIKDLFEDYALDSTLTSTKSWYEKELMEDNYCIVRFEFDNSNGKQLILHDTTVQAQKTNR